jgi:hypothetical protein
MAAAQKELTPDGIQRLRAEGHALSLEQVVAETD